MKRLILGGKNMECTTYELMLTKSSSALNDEEMDRLKGIMCEKFLENDYFIHITK